MRVLSPGKLRGMGQIASTRGVITVTAIDHRGSLEAMLKRAMPGQPIGFRGDGAARSLRITRALAPLSTGRAARSAPRRSRPVPRRRSPATPARPVPRGVRLRRPGRGPPDRDDQGLERRQASSGWARVGVKRAALLPPRRAGRRRSRRRSWSAWPRTAGATTSRSCSSRCRTPSGPASRRRAPSSRGSKTAVVIEFGPAAWARSA
mgnify:CR=1 FL=1